MRNILTLTLATMLVATPIQAEKISRADCIALRGLLVWSSEYIEIASDLTQTAMLQSMGLIISDSQNEQLSENIDELRKKMDIHNKKLEETSALTEALHPLRVKCINAFAK